MQPLPEFKCGNRMLSEMTNASSALHVATLAPDSKAEIAPPKTRLSGSVWKPT
jgi:hypothetical protein